MLPSPTKEKCKEEKEIQLANNRRGKQHKIECTDPSRHGKRRGHANIVRGNF